MLIFLIFQSKYFFILINFSFFPFFVIFMLKFILILICFTFIFYFIFPWLFYDYSFIHIRLVGSIPFKVIAAFQSYFSHYSHPAPRAALGHTVTGSCTGILATTFRVSPSPLPLF
jgi:hypothetical protein